MCFSPAFPFPSLTWIFYLISNIKNQKYDQMKPQPLTIKTTPSHGLGNPNFPSIRYTATQVGKNEI